MVENSEAVGLRGLVSVFKGSEQIFDCLIVRSEDFGHAACFEYKRKLGLTLSQQRLCIGSRSSDR